MSFFIIQHEMSIVKNCKFILYKEKYYAIAYKLNFIFNLKLSVYNKRKYKFKCYSLCLKHRLIVDKYYFISTKYVKNMKYVNRRLIVYFKYNKCHRDNKPAKIWYYEDGNVAFYKYYIDGEVNTYVY